MCPRATVEHGGAAMTSVAPASAHSFGEEEYIDLDLSSCGEYEFWVCQSRAPCTEEMLYRGRLHKVAPRPGGKLPDTEATTLGGCGRRSVATVAPLQHSHVRSAQPARTRAGKAVHAKLQVFFRSLFARTSCSDHERCHGGIGVPCPFGSIIGKNGGIGVPSGRKATLVCETKNGGGGVGPTTLRSSIEQEKLMDEVEEEQATSSIRERKSFSGVVRWRTTTAATGRSRNSCGSRAPAALKRSSSCRSESEGLIQGAIAYCKRSQQQQRVLLARKSVSDAALCSPPSRRVEYCSRQFPGCVCSTTCA